MTPADNYNACGYCCDWMPCGKILRQCIKIGYSSAQCNKIGYSSAECIEIGYSSAQCIKIGHSSVQGNKIRNRVFSALCDNFRHCDFFRIFFLSNFWPTRARRWIIILPSRNFYGCGYWYDLMQCEKILCQCIKTRYGWNVLGLFIVRWSNKVRYSGLMY